MKKRQSVNVDAAAWIVALLALIVEIIADHQGMQQRWHAAILWTAVALAPSVIGLRDRWNLGRFWFVWMSCLGLHLFAIWFVFSVLLSRIKILGTLYILPLAAIESLAIYVLLLETTRRRK